MSIILTIERGTTDRVGCLRSGYTPTNTRRFSSLLQSSKNFILFSGLVSRSCHPCTARDHASCNTRNRRSGFRVPILLNIHEETDVTCHEAVGYLRFKSRNWHVESRLRHFATSQVVWPWPIQNDDFTPVCAEDVVDLSLSSAVIERKGIERSFECCGV